MEQNVIEQQAEQTKDVAQETWVTPVLEEITVSCEINSYMSADL